MIMCEYFKGDNNETLMRVQHDIYSYMVYFLYKYSANRYLQDIKLAFVSPDFVPIIRNKKSFDHRVLQHQHDLIAANYRYFLASREEYSPFPSDFDLKGFYKEVWKKYYLKEVDLLAEIDEISEQIVTAVAFENTDRGYAAEEKLTLLLLQRYVGLPQEIWRRK